MTRRLRPRHTVLFAAAASACWAVQGLSASANEIRADPETRRAAEALAIWGLENDANLALLGGLSGLLAAGVLLDPDDPWRAHDYAETLRQRAGRDAGILSQLSLLMARPRGVLDGISRIDAVLEPGENLTVTLQMAKAETALVEARIKNDGKEADIDLVVKSLTGETLASDVGPATGIEGIGTFVQWVPPACDLVDVIVTNVGAVSVRVVMMAPPSRQESCDPT